jgi:hypothetical protein
MSVHDAAESRIHQLDEAAREKSGMGLLHWLTIGSIAASIALFASGKKHAAIFIGLWPPTFQALRQK